MIIEEVSILYAVYPVVSEPITLSTTLFSILTGCVTGCVGGATMAVMQKCATKKYVKKEKFD